METTTGNINLLVFALGVLIALSLLAKAFLRRINLPGVIGWIAIGFAFRLVGERFGLLTESNENILGFLAQVGIVALLFKVGLESNLAKLVGQLRSASLVWAGDVSLSGLAGFLGAYYLLGISLLPSLMIGAALTATSVGVTVSVWQEAGALDTAGGQLLVDVAEMDDISGILLLGILFSILPVLQGKVHGPILSLLGGTVLLFMVRMVLFAAFCFFFAHYIEKPIVRFVKKLERGPGPMLTVASIGFIIASIAALLDFSLALGAFFAGLAFSRDPEAVKLEASFEPIYELFTPFFFIGLGLYVDPASLKTAAWMPAVLLLMAILGKSIGAGVPVLIGRGRKHAALLGLSMIPRAEIAMVIMEHGRRLGDSVVSSKVFSSMVLVSLLSCMLAPPIVRLLLRRWPPQGAVSEG